MSDNSQAIETTAERKPPTLADIVREKTGDGALIIDFFTDVMMGRIEGAELCHRIDAAKQLVKYGSKDAAEFLAKYKGVPCGHSINGRPDPADPCSAADRSLVAVTLNAPPTLTRDFLTVLSGIDEFLMARLIRAQTADGGTIIEFLDDVMQDRTDGFKTHHRIAAAKELIVHIVRDEQPEPTPREPEPSSTVVPAEAGTQGSGGGHNTPANSAHPEPVLSNVEGPSSTVIPAKAGIQRGGGRNTAANSAHPEPSSPVVPAEAGTQEGGGVRSTAANSTRTEPRQILVPAESLPRTRYGAGTQGSGGGRSTAANSAHPETAEGRQDDKARRPRTRRTRTQRRRDGNARAATRRKALGSERIEEEKDEKPAPVELTIAERRIKEKLEQHWHEPDPWAGPIDSTHPGRSPPLVTATRPHNRIASVEGGSYPFSLDGRGRSLP